MATNFTLTLDTQAPVITWGTISAATPGESFTADYSINEPEVISAVLVDADDVHHVLTVGPTSLTATLALSAANGPAQIRALVRDEVDNEATRTYSLTIGAAPEVEEEQEPGAGGGRSYTYGPIKARKDFEFEADVSLKRLEPVEFSFDADARLRRQLERNLDITFTLIRPIEFSFEAVREPAPRYTAALRDEEELLLTL